MRALILSTICFYALASSAIEVPPEEDTYQKIKRLCAEQQDYVSRTIRRAGNKTIELETFVCAEGDWKTAKAVFGHVAGYQRWALKNINQRPDGSTYYMQIVRLSPDRNDPSILNGSFLFNLPLFKQQIDRSFRMTTNASDKAFTLVGETATPSTESVIGSGGGFLRIFPADSKPGRLWIYVKGHIVLRNWILYEALPERLMSRESGERIQIVVENYQAEEQRLFTQPTSTPVAKSKVPPARQ